MDRFASSQRCLLGLLVGFVASWFLFHHVCVEIHLNIFTPEQRQGVHATPAQPSLPAPIDPSSPRSDIPNIVHFIELLPDTTSFAFGLSQFIAVYSAYYYLRPETIYIHTNAHEGMIEAARRSGNQFTRAIMNLPNVVFRHTVPPRHTSRGVPIERLQHKADFVMTKVLREFGGIYLHTDVYVVKDFAPLLQSGFKAILGLQKHGVIYNRLMMCTTDSHLLSAFDELQDMDFNGWTSRSEDLLARVAAELSMFDKENQVLVMGQNAFFPLSGEDPDIWEMYRMQENWDPHWIEESERLPSFDIRAYMEYLQTGGPASWNRWDMSWAIHGWSSSLRGNILELFGEYGGLNLDYIMAKKSHFARGVYPAVKHAIDMGIIEWIPMEVDSS